MATSPKQSYYKLFAISTIVIFALLLIRVGYIVFAGNPSRKIYQDPKVASTVVRGTIYDRNGKILAIQTPYYGLYFHLNEIDDLQKAAELVAPFVGMNPDQVQLQASHYTTYAQIKRKIDPDKVEPLQQVIQRAGLSRELSVVKEMGRTYPAQFHAAQTIGFTDNENKGLEGIEYTQEQYLDPFPELGNEEVTYGQDITLTLDIDIQYLLDLQMQSIADVHNPDYAMGIILDAKNGDILALSSYPWYNTNEVNHSNDEERLNHAVNYLYEPGSVFKIFSLAAVMQVGQADLLTPFQCDGSYTFDSGNGKMVTINCTEPHGTVNPRTMIQKSCNGAIATWAMETNSQDFYELLNKFGFNQAYDINLPSKSKGSIQDPSKWSGRSEATISFGQELSSTALHLATAATVFTNKGELLAPHLILSRSVGNATGKLGKVLYERERTVQRQVVSESVASKLLSYMQSATEKGGTAINTAVDGILVGAKTGTAQILNNETNSYSDGTVLASTMAIVPADDPKYIIYIAAGNPKGNTIWGSNIAAPAIGKVIKALVSQGKLTSSKSVQL
ncbi:penicillin-binding protein 2 [uncultured Sphaerochaeta sp.]|uniref:peptidoglycan D,D-transpeptidase FtsI family protein n=1 Tax=uncultured Sphaerochaeta sp. TaxID=886478 RepID=UPI002A0A96A6|nr:penicillin-binding protein 2 [uncultured Sphaerochaeta sp.]